MWRKAVIQGIKADPAWHGGNYESEPTMGLRVAESLLQVVGAAPLYLKKQYGTRETTRAGRRTDEHTSELQSLMRILYAVFSLQQQKQNQTLQLTTRHSPHDITN